MFCPSCQYDNPTHTTFCAQCGSPLLTDTVSAILASQTVLQDRYVITQHLGQGGMGSVYRANDLRLSTATWAIKEMSQAAMSSPLELQRARADFRHEAEMLAGLNHPNLPRVTDHFEQDGKLYLVMEYLPGETLLSFIQREGLPQPQGQVVAWAQQLCDVLSYLHSQQPPIIFRDLKPANIILTPNGQLKLIDFGIARWFKSGKTQDTQIFGTMGYSAPEQYGRGQTDARSDVYSLGVLTYQLLTGYDPADTPFHLPPARLINPALTPQLADVLTMATHDNPSQRFANVLAFQAALAAATSDSQRFATISAYTSATTSMYARPNSVPLVIASMPASTTGLANTSRWVGMVSFGLMGIAALLVAIDSALGDSSGPIAGFGYFIAFVPLLSGPVALLTGLIALVGVNTNQTIAGRRHSIIGITTGILTLLLCCAIGVVVGSVHSNG